MRKLKKVRYLNINMKGLTTATTSLDKKFIFIQYKAKHGIEKELWLNLPFAIIGGSGKSSPLFAVCTSGRIKFRRWVCPPGFCELLDCCCCCAAVKLLSKWFEKWNTMLLHETIINLRISLYATNRVPW